jgi:hypothetical protein
VDADHPPWVDADHPLSHIEVALRCGTACQICSTFARMPLVTPCAHLLCVDCAAPHRHAPFLLLQAFTEDDLAACTKQAVLFALLIWDRPLAAASRTECPLCKEPYRMQSVEDRARRDNNPNPKWEVPIDVIEWQPSYTQQVV